MICTLRAVAVVLTAGAVAVQATTTCGTNNPCPSSAPCCSQYGECGVGAYCLGGCDPQYSYDLNSCMAAPVCQSADYKLNSLDDIMANTEYLGDPSQANWVSSGTPLAYNNNSILLTMADNTVGTLLTSTRYVWYGKISATMTTSQGAGVVTAFIMMSDVKDEIDFEFVGVDIEHTQSNYYFQGITADGGYDNEQNLTVADTVNTHTYTFDWQPDVLTWAVDGTVLRTKYRNETYNSTTGQYHYPQSPARIELSLWPAGLSTNGQGTIDWAGGLVDWNSQYMANGYYYAMFTDVSVECYDPPSGYLDQGTSAYHYNSTAGTNNTVAITNDNTILASFYATGDDQKKDPDASSSVSSAKTATKTAASSASTSASVDTVPGVSGAGSRGDSSSSDASSDSAASSASTAAGSTSTATSSGGFSQGDPSDGKSGGARVVAGSLVALVAFFAAAMLV